MRIVICEDDIKQRRKLQNLIIQNSFTNDWDTEIVLCAESPQQVLSYIEHKKVDCYFLDIELNSAQNGLELALSCQQNSFGQLYDGLLLVSST